MKLRTTAVLTGTLLMCVQHLIQAQSQPGIANTFTRGEPRQIESALEQRLSALANIVCHEQVNRYARKGRNTSQLDTLDLNVEVLNGIERYSGIHRNQKTFRSMQNVPGTWSVGEMATLLSATRDAIELGDVRMGQDRLADLGQSFLMTFAYPASSRRWFLKANSQVDWLPFEGSVWTSPETGEIQRVSWLANDLPAESGVAQVLWTVDFSPVNLSSFVLTLPRKALYQVTYKNSADHVDWNVTSFSEYRRYGSDTAVHFDAEER